MTVARMSDAGKPIRNPYPRMTASVTATAALRGRMRFNSAETATASTEMCMPEMQIRWVMPVWLKRSVSSESMPVRSPSTNARTSSALSGKSSPIRSEIARLAAIIHPPSPGSHDTTSTSSSFAAAMPVMPSDSSHSRASNSYGLVAASCGQMWPKQLRRWPYSMPSSGRRSLRR